MNNETNEDYRNEINFSDKNTFVVAFFALVIALSPLNGFLNKISVSILIGEYSLLDLVYVPISLLALSMYAYAINYIRYDYALLFSWRWLRHIESLANVLYLLAILAYPLLVLGMYLLDRIIQVIAPVFSRWLESAVVLRGSIFSILSILISVLVIILQFWKSQKELENTKEQLRINEKYLKDEIGRLSSRGDHEMVLLKTYNNLVNTIELDLAEKYGPIVSKMSPPKIVDMARSARVLLPEEVSLIADIRGVRNRIAHSTENNVIPEEAAKDLVEKTNKIIKRLETEMEMKEKK